METKEQQLIVDELGARIITKFDKLINEFDEFRRKLQWNLAGVNDDYICYEAVCAKIQIDILKSAQGLIAMTCKEYKEEMEQ